MIAWDDILAKGVALDDHLPVNIYKGNTKVAGWHPQTVSGEGTISLDGAYNVPPDALTIDGKCVQTGTPSPSTPAPITTITGDLTITAANGDLSDTVVTPLSSVELCSLPDGTEDAYDAVTGVLTKRVGKLVFDGSVDERWMVETAIDGVHKFFQIIKNIGADNCVAGFVMNNQYWSHFAIMNPYTVYMQGAWIFYNAPNTNIRICHPDFPLATDLTAFKSWLAANPVTVYYKLATPYTIQLTPDLPVVRTGIKTLTVSANITPSFTATAKAMD